MKKNLFLNQRPVISEDHLVENAVIYVSKEGRIMQ